MSEAMLKALEFFGISSLMGWIMLFSGLHSQRDTRRREAREYTRTTGQIVDYVGREVPSGKRGHTVYWTPVVEFTADGRLCRFEYAYNLDRKQHPVGEKADVLYDVGNPSHFHLESDASFYHGGSSVMRIGLIWIIASLALSIVLSVLVGGASLRELTFFGSGLKKTEQTQNVSVKESFQYEVKSDNTAVIRDYAGADDELTLPVMLDGHLVTGIANGAFMSAHQLTSLHVPGTIVDIPAGAFAGCVGLSEVSLGEGVSIIDRSAFAACMSLRDVMLPASLNYIADDAFPDDCAAVFHVAANSLAEQYCREKGLQVQIEP